MSGAGLFGRARWIWIDSGDAGAEWNRWVLFRKSIPAEAIGAVGETGRLVLNVAADAHYRLWVNGERRGEGPARSWPDELFFDSVDVTDAAGSGRLDVEILVRHFRPGTGAYVGGEPGCAAVLSRAGGEKGGEEIVAVTDGTWECADHPGYRESVVKMSNGMAYAEVYRADEAERDASWVWKAAADRGPAATTGRRIIPRDIPPLAEEVLQPCSIVRRRRVKTPGFFRSVNLRPLVFPEDRDVNKHKRFSGILAVGIRSEREGSAGIGLTVDPHDTEPVTFIVGGRGFSHENGLTREAAIGKGENLLRVLVSGEYHDPTFHFHFVLPDGAVLEHPLGDSDAETPFAFLGPLARASHVQAGDPVPPAQEDVIPVSVLASLDPRNPDFPDAAFLGTVSNAATALRTIPSFCVSPHHVALECMAAKPVDDADTAGEHAAVPGGGCGSYTGKGEAAAEFPLTVFRDAATDAETILDFGREVSGFLELDIEAAEGTVVDFFCFESLHSDGLIEHTYSLNNSLRYVCGGGRRRYSSFVRRGFRYAMAVIRGVAIAGREDVDVRRVDAGPGASGPATVHGVTLRESLFPRTSEASFATSDPRLDDIWRISKRTVALCMEDTYVDCPAYEQTYWTGDARNTALYSYCLFGAGPLFLRGARLAARSLERSRLIESHVPSAWRNVIPTWSFFHVIAGVEYRFYTGDDEGFLEIYPSLVRTMENASDLRVVMDDGSRLFAMHAWNMVDWAPMDVPDDGIIAHQNAQFVLACRILAEASRETGDAETASRLEAWADETAEGFLRWFWSEEVGAFRDCLGRDGSPSRIFSVQTQLFAYMAGIGDEALRNRLKAVIKNPPDDFVTIASPFVRHFLYELMERWAEYDGVIDEIRETWGSMIDNGATTCWEGWSFIPGHFTRSHCHAWSAAPAFFLPTIVLGIRPTARGFGKVSVRPHPAGLSRAEGSLPTPLGPLRVSWKIKDGRMSLAVDHPKGMDIEAKTPRGLAAGDISVRERAIGG